MKILHTADWHVGKALRGRHRAEEHEAVLTEIIRIAEEEEADLVCVAGDQFDSASPTPEAEQIVYRALLELAETGATVLVVPGNHDNARRLAAVAPVFAGLGRVVVQPFMRSPDEGGVAELQTRSGEPARVAFLPFLSQRYAVRAADLMGTDAADQSLKYADRLRAVIAKLTEGFTTDSVNILLGHLTVTGGVTGGGERMAQTIFDYWVDPQCFPASCHYAALGHLHRAQRVIGPCPIWYSGSPLQLDFGETGDTKSVLVVEATKDAPAQVREIPLGSGRRLRTLRGTVAQLEELAETTGDDFLRIFVQEPSRVGLADEIRDLFPNCIDVIVESPESEEVERPSRLESGLAPQDLFAMYLEERGVSDERLVELFQRLYEEARI